MSLELHISAASYLEEGVSCFTLVLTEDNNEDKGDTIAKEPEVSNSKEEKKKLKFTERVEGCLGCQVSCRFFFIRWWSAWVFLYAYYICVWVFYSVRPLLV